LYGKSDDSGNGRRAHGTGDPEIPKAVKESMLRNSCRSERAARYGIADGLKRRREICRKAEIMKDRRAGGKQESTG
jgi:hypothetical protein